MNVILRLMLALTAAAAPLQPPLPLVGQTKEYSVSIKDLRAAPTMILLDNRSFSVSAFPWRDFMPGSWGPVGSPLMVGLKIASADKKPLPSGIRLDRAWILFGEEIWEVSDLRGRRQDHGEDSWINCSDIPACEVTVRNGPKWGPGVFVDVVVQLTDREGQRHFLQAPSQLVRASS